MTRILIFFFLGLFVVTTMSCGVPESARSIEVVNRVKPVLEGSLSSKGLVYGSAVFIRIFKESNELEVWVESDSKFQLFKTYPIFYFSGKLGPKLKEGDMQAPEGFYFVPSSRMNPNSRYHLSFNLGYPNKYDRSHARTGSALMVHGSTVSIGCFAMTDPLIEEIYTLVDGALKNGQKYFRVHIFPFRMSLENIKRHQEFQWIDFWYNLKEGYDFFESSLNPPNVEVKNGRYVFD